MTVCFVFIWGGVKTLNYKKQASLYVNIKPYSEALFFIQK